MAIADHNAQDPVKENLVLAPLSVGPMGRLAAWLRGAAVAPVATVASVAVLAVALSAIIVGGDWKTGWDLVTTQDHWDQEGEASDPNLVAKREGALAQADLEERLALAAEGPKGDIHQSLQCLATNVYFEARNESDLGRLAVAHVVMNRVASKRFPSSVCGVVRQGGEKTRNRCQFSWFCDGKKDDITDMASWAQAMKAAREVFWEQSNDPTAGALWYHADYVKPKWRKAFDKTAVIGRHLFYAPKAKAEVRPQVADASGGS